jgi:hypothetical protein
MLVFQGRKWQAIYDRVWLAHRLVVFEKSLYPVRHRNILELKWIGLRLSSLLSRSDDDGLDFLAIR